MQSREPNTRNDWTDRSRSDPSVTLLELLAYVLDELSYRQDRVAEEAYLRKRRRYALFLGSLALLLFLRWRTTDRKDDD